MVEHQFSKLDTRVRFSSPAHVNINAPIAQWIEQDGSNVKVGGSSPSGRTNGLG